MPSGGIGAVATQAKGSLAGLAKLITAGSYVAGMAFAVGAVVKFKAHKDNPTQIPYRYSQLHYCLLRSIDLYSFCFQVCGCNFVRCQVVSWLGVSGITVFHHNEKLQVVCMNFNWQ